MENSLFSINENYDPNIESTVPPNAYQQPTNNEAVLQALLSVSAGRSIMQDTSVGKKDSLTRLAPQSRGLRNLINAVDGTSDSISIKGVEEAIDILDTMDDIVMNKFTVPTPLNV